MELKKTVMLTDDIKSVGRKVGDKLGLDEVYAELLPDQMVEKLEAKEKQKSTKIASAIKIARHTRMNVRQNIIFALAMKGIVLILRAGGIATMWEAVFADVVDQL